jgi:hypothetical protein
VRKAELHDGLLAIELERSVKDATVKTVRIADGEASRATPQSTMRSE